MKKNDAPFPILPTSKFLSNKDVYQGYLDNLKKYKFQDLKGVVHSKHFAYRSPRYVL